MCHQVSTQQGDCGGVRGLDAEVLRGATMGRQDGSCGVTFGKFGNGSQTVDMAPAKSMHIYNSQFSAP
jgi:hypothetical protein